jgi:hypothetical protein
LRGKHLKLAAVLLSALFVLPPGTSASAYDAEKTAREGLVRGDLATWTQRRESFPENGELSVNGSSPLSYMGCGYYATFFMLCRMGLRNPLVDTAWELAEECRERGFCRSGTGYFDPRSISMLTDGLAEYVEDGCFENYYDGQAGIAHCESKADVDAYFDLLMNKKGYFLVVCVVGDVTSRTGSEYGSAGHYIFIDSTNHGNWVIGDPAFPGTRWNDNWGRHNASVVKVYAYRLWDRKGKQIFPSARQSMYVPRSFEDY